MWDAVKALPYAFCGLVEKIRPAGALETGVLRTFWQTDPN